MRWRATAGDVGQVPGDGGERDATGQRRDQGGDGQLGAEQSGGESPYGPAAGVASGRRPCRPEGGDRRGFAVEFARAGCDPDGVEEPHEGTRGAAGSAGEQSLDGFLVQAGCVHLVTLSAGTCDNVTRRARSRG
ncbi:hypothetical protein [Micromonospora sp. NBS 11-29]|uniref:hypothetical protein n=1 Tax=Micromonospora sp. NBS 11-29 TaxID=1960879 RepID=UPI00111E9970|nr:hypothetical protein [Micromonospora sp. NBS 11-29]